MVENNIGASYSLGRYIKLFIYIQKKNISITYKFHYFTCEVYNLRRQFGKPIF